MDDFFRLVIDRLERQEAELRRMEADQRRFRRAVEAFRRQQQTRQDAHRDLEAACSGPAISTAWGPIMPDDAATVVRRKQVQADLAQADRGFAAIIQGKPLPADSEGGEAD